MLVQHGVSVEDSQMTILRGHFTMMLVLALPEEVDLEALEGELAQEGGLDDWSLRQVEDAAPGPAPSHMITVYGADHPGIVHAAASALAERGINITDLNSRLMEEAGTAALFVLMMEVALPQGASVTELDSALAEVSAREGVEVAVRELEHDEL